MDSLYLCFIVFPLECSFTDHEVDAVNMLYSPGEARHPHKEKSRVETDLEGSLLAAADILLALAQGRQTQGGRGGVLVC